MAIIYSYPVVQPTTDDLVLGTDATDASKPTKNFTVQSIIDLVTVSGNDLQAVLNNGNVATGRDINLTNNNFRGGSFITTGNATITGTIGSGFTQITADDFTGNLTGIVKAGSSIESTVTGVTQSQGDNSTKLATTAYVDGKVDPSVLQYLGDSTGPFDLNLISDDFKIAGTANEIETTATTVAGNVGTVTLSFPTAGVTLPDGSVATTQALTDNSTKVATTAFVHGKNDAQTLNFSNGSNASTVLLNSQTFVVSGTTNQIATATTPQKITIGLTTDVTIAGTYTGATFSGDLNGTVNTATTGTTQSAGDNSTKIATTAYVDNAAGAKILQYKDSTSTIHDLNLSDDDLQFNGDSNITVTAAAVSSNVGTVTVDLNNDVTISGTMQAGTLSDGTFSGTGGTYTGGVSITSTDFVGALTGNADTATALAASGAIALTGDTTSTGGPYTYTSGGALSIATTIADTTVTGKVLTNLPTATSQVIADSDTILEALSYLQGQITGIPQGLVYKGTWDASTNTPTLASGTGVTGEFYIVSVAGTTNLDGITDWQVGDWAIFVEVGATDTWQKIDNTSAILGSGTANKIAKWTGSNTLATGLISDDGTDVTIGNSGNLIVEGNTTLGDADTDTTTVKGPGVFEETTQFNVGIGLSSTPDYGTAGQVLTSGGGSATANTWTTPTTGTVTSVGLTETGDALTITGSPVTSSGTINIAGAGTASQYINGELDLVTFPTVDNYQYWTLAGDSGTPQNITSTNTATIAGGLGINTLIPGASTDTINVNIDYIGADNAILSAPAGTPAATDELWFNNADVSNGSIQRATISDIVDLGNETLSQVLSNGNTTSGTNIAVSAADDITFTDSSQAIFGSSSDFLIYHDGTNSSYIVNSNTLLPLQVLSNDFQVRSHTGSEKMILANVDSSVELYYDAAKKFETTSTGVEVTGDIDISGNIEVNQIEVGTSTSFMRISSNQIYKETNGSAGWMYITGSVVQLQGTGSGNVIVGSTSQTTSDKTLSVRCDSNSVSTLAAMSHQTYLAGGATKQGGIYTGRQTVNNATQTTIFTLTSNSLIFDVMLTCKSSVTNYQPVYITKKYSVARTTGQTSPNYFKIIDSGPGVGSGGAPTRDFTVDFVGDSTTGLECKITGSGGTTHEVNYTIIIGNIADGALGVTGY
jgi:hypothetical protein